MTFYEHLLSRSWAPYLHTWVDWKQEVITFPLWVPGGRLIGYIKYVWGNPKKRNNGAGGRYFTWVADAYKKCYVYGYDSLFGHGPLFIVEGVWDAIRVQVNWYDCLATLTATPTAQTKQWIKFVACGRPVIALADDDAKLGRRWADIQVLPINAHDIGDMSRVAVGEMLNNICKEL